MGLLVSRHLRALLADEYTSAALKPFSVANEKLPEKRWYTRLDESLSSHVLLEVFFLRTAPVATRPAAFMICLHSAVRMRSNR